MSKAYIKQKKEESGFFLFPTFSFLAASAKHLLPHFLFSLSSHSFLPPTIFLLLGFLSLCFCFPPSAPFPPHLQFPSCSGYFFSPITSLSDSQSLFVSSQKVALLFPLVSQINLLGHLSFALQIPWEFDWYPFWVFVDQFSPSALRIISLPLNIFSVNFIFSLTELLELCC